MYGTLGGLHLREGNEIFELSKLAKQNKALRKKTEGGEYVQHDITLRQPKTGLNVKSEHNLANLKIARKAILNKLRKNFNLDISPINSTSTQSGSPSQHIHERQ